MSNTLWKDTFKKDTVISVIKDLYSIATTMELPKLDLGGATEGLNSSPQSNCCGPLLWGPPVVQPITHSVLAYFLPESASLHCLYTSLSLPSVIGQVLFLRELWLGQLIQYSYFTNKAPERLSNLQTVTEPAKLVTEPWLTKLSWVTIACFPNCSQLFKYLNPLIYLLSLNFFWLL